MWWVDWRQITHVAVKSEHRVNRIRFEVFSVRIRISKFSIEVLIISMASHHHWYISMQPEREFSWLASRQRLIRTGVGSLFFEIIELVSKQFFDTKTYRGRDLLIISHKTFWNFGVVFPLAKIKRLLGTMKSSGNGTGKWIKIHFLAVRLTC